MKCRCSFPTALILVCLVGGCGSQQSETTPQTTKALPRKEQAEPKVEPKVEAKVEPKVEEKDPEQQAFIKLVKQNADDPRNLEIILWEEKKKGTQDGQSYRQVRFRCNQVGHTQQMVSYRLSTRPPPRMPGNPVMVEDASIEYRGDTIVMAGLSKTYQQWWPK